MCLTLAPGGIASARYYPESQSSHNFGPHVVWYAGGRNYAVKGVKALPLGKYNVMFGGGAAKLIVRSGQLSPSAEDAQKFNTLFGFRYTNAKHRTDPVADNPIISILSG